MAHLPVSNLTRRKRSLGEAGIKAFFWNSYAERQLLGLESIGPCWEWQRARQYLGYGHFRYQRKTHKAHRIAWLFTYGSIPDGLDILHRCDNRCCIRPEHLFSGDHKTNMADMIAKGRLVALPGDDNGNSVLTGEQVAKLRERRAEGASYSVLMKEFGIAKTTVSHIVKRHTWKHIPECT